MNFPYRIKKTGFEFVVTELKIQKNKVTFRYLDQAGKEKNGDTVVEEKGLAFKFWGDQVFSGKKCNGLKVEAEEQKKEIAEYLESLKKEYAEKKEELIKQILSGEILLEIGVVGCDFPEYVPNCTQFEKDGFDTFEILTLVLKRVGIEREGSRSIDLLKRQLNADVMVNKYPSYAVNLIRDLKKQNYFSFKPEVVTDFSAKLLNILGKTIEEAAAQKAAAEKESARKAAGKEFIFFCESEPCKVDPSEILNAPCPEGGAYTTKDRIPKDAWEKIKDHARYYDQEFLEECDMFYSSPGWRYDATALEILRGLGYIITIENEKKQEPPKAPEVTKEPEETKAPADKKEERKRKMSAIMKTAWRLKKSLDVEKLAAKLGVLGVTIKTTAKQAYQGISLAIQLAWAVVRTQGLEALASL